MEPPSILATVNLMARTLEFITGRFEGFDMLRQSQSGDARLNSIVEEIHAEWWNDLMRLLRDWKESRSEREAADAFNRVMGDAEAGMLLANYVRDAYFEPLQRRRRMLEHAVLGLLDLSLSLDDLARVWRGVQALSPDDVMVLYALWLIPQRGPRRRASVDNNFYYWDKSDADALDGVAVRVTTHVNAGSTPRLKIARTGLLILRALRTFVWNQPLPADIPMHEHRGDFRSRDDALEFLRSASLLESTVGYKNHPFDDGVQFEGFDPTEAVPANGKARVVFKGMKDRDIEAIRAATMPAPSTELKRARPVDRIFIEHSVSSPKRPGNSEVHIAGPFDVLRVLAYDLNAKWI